MKTAFPGMDPYLEHPSLWPDVHNSLIAAIRDDLSPKLAPRYYVGLERRAYLMKPDDIALIGRPDLAIIPHSARPVPQALPLAGAGVLTVDVPMREEVSENYLEVREVFTGKLVTVIELLSPANKLHPEGREQYERKRGHIFLSYTNLVELDLLREGQPMAVIGPPVVSDYRILVSRGLERPHAQLLPFTIRQPIPSFHVPLLPGDKEPLLALTAILHALYSRARFDLRLDYNLPPVPPLREEDAEWARGLMA